MLCLSMYFFRSLNSTQGEIRVGPSHQVIPATTQMFTSCIRFEYWYIFLMILEPNVQWHVLCNQLSPNATASTVTEGTDWLFDCWSSSRYNFCWPHSSCAVFPFVCMSYSLYVWTYLLNVWQILSCTINTKKIFIHLIHIHPVWSYIFSTLLNHPWIFVLQFLMNNFCKFWVFEWLNINDSSVYY